MTLLSWESAAEWDNAVSESDVNHPDGILSLSKVVDDFSDGDYTNNPSWTHNGVGSATVTSDTQPDGSTGNVLDINADSVTTWATVELDRSSSNPRADFTWIGAFKKPGSETHADGGFAFRVQDSNNYYYIRDGSGGDKYVFVAVSGGSHNTLVGGTSFSGRSTNGQWSIWKVVASGDTFEFYTKAPGSSSFTQEFSTTDTTISSAGTIRIGPNLNQKGTVSRRMFFDDQETPYYASSGTLTTATKSFASATKTNLTNLEYSLNGGSVTLDVIGSPGTASEEIVTQTLDGSERYDLSWSNKHTDYRVKLTLSNGNDTTPEVYRVGVEGGDTSTLRWGTTTEWNNATSNQNVAHHGGGEYVDSDIQLGYDPANLPGSPTAYWTVHEPSGDFVDVINGYNAVPDANVDREDSGIGIGSAANFKGSHNAPIKTLNYSSSGAISQMSVVGWVNIGERYEGGGQSGDILGFDRSEYFRLEAWDKNGVPKFSTTDSGGSTHDLYANTMVEYGWMMVGGVYDGTDKHIYVNPSGGSPSATSLNPHGGSALGTGTTRYGFLSDDSEASSYDGSTNGEYLSGRLAEVIYWDDYALSGGEMQNLYDAIAGNNASLITTEKVNNG